MRIVRVLLVTAALGLTAAPASADAPGVCVRTPGSIWWEVCAARDNCLVYVWFSMPPALCLTS